MNILIISGKQGSGKTSLQKAIHYLWNDLSSKHVCAEYNFADVLREMHDEVLHILHNYWPDRGLVKDGPLMQLLGTEWGRNTVDQNIWVNILKTRLEKANKIFEDLGQIPLFVVGDCRFENEFNAFGEAFRVRLNAPEAIRRERCEMWRENTGHPSETGLDHFSNTNKFDMYLNTEKQTLEECANAVMNELTLRGRDLKCLS